MAQALGFEIPEEDLAPLATALRDQLSSIKRLARLHPAESGPAVRFDPRWHD
jgi:hypothetical protein